MTSVVQLVEKNPKTKTKDFFIQSKNSYVKILKYIYISDYLLNSFCIALNTYTKIIKDFSIS